MAANCRPVEGRCHLPLRHWTFPCFRHPAADERRTLNPASRLLLYLGERSKAGTGESQMAEVLGLVPSCFASPCAGPGHLRKERFRQEQSSLETRLDLFANAGSDERRKNASARIQCRNRTQGPGAQPYPICLSKTELRQESIGWSRRVLARRSRSQAKSNARSAAIAAAQNSFLGNEVPGWRRVKRHRTGNPLYCGFLSSP